MAGKKEAAGSAKGPTNRPREQPQHGGPDDDPCRCKQVAIMTPKQMLGTMLKDLAFWKKEKK